MVFHLNVPLLIRETFNEDDPLFDGKMVFPLGPRWEGGDWICRRTKRSALQARQYKDECVFLSLLFLPVGVHKQDAKKACYCILLPSMQTLRRDTKNVSSQWPEGSQKCETECKGTVWEDWVSGKLDNQSHASLGNP